MLLEFPLGEAHRTVELADQAVDSRPVRLLVVRPPRGVLIAQRDGVDRLRPLPAEHYTGRRLVCSHQLPAFAVISSRSSAMDRADRRASETPTRDSSRFIAPPPCASNAKALS